MKQLLTEIITLIFTGLIFGLLFYGYLSGCGESYINSIGKRIYYQCE